MWRSGAPQRRGTRGAFRGAEAHTCCYAKYHFGSSLMTLQPQTRVRTRLNRGPARQSMKMRAPGVVKFSLSKMAAPEFRNG